MPIYGVQLRSSLGLLTTNLALNSSFQNRIPACPAQISHQLQTAPVQSKHLPIQSLEDVIVGHGARA